MLLLIILWLALIAVSMPVGVHILQLLRARQFDRSGDRFIVSVWLGLAVLSLLLLAASLLFALSPIVGIVLAGSLVLLSLLRRETRSEMRAFGVSLSPRLSFGALMLALGVAAYETLPTRYYDTGLYHFGAIKWLSQFGAVPGLSLLHMRFGLASSWFALAAPFNAGILEARITTLLGGLALLLAAIHFLLCASRCLTNRARLSDWVIVAASAYFIPSALYRILFLSPSPDVAVMVLTVVVAWTIVVISEHPRPEKTPKKRGLVPDASIIPFILSAFALTNKLSAIAIVTISALFYLYRSRFSPGSFLSLSLIGLAFVAPIIGYQIMTAGCPLLPTGLMCLDLPWSLGAEEARHYTDLVITWGRWGGPPPPDAGSLDWLWRGWFTLGTTSRTILAVGLSTIAAIAGLIIVRLRGAGAAQVGRTLAAIGIAGTTFLLMFRAPNLLFAYVIVLALATYKRQFEGKNWLLGIGLLGMCIAFYGAPSITYNYGYIAVLSACIIVSYRDTLRHALHYVSVKLRARKPAETLALLLIAGGLVFGLCRFALTNQPPHSSPFASNEEEGPALFMPPRLPAAVVVPRRVNDIDFYLPIEGDQCWAAQLPCAPGLFSADVVLRDPVRGIAAGFRHSRSSIIQTKPPASP